MTAPNGNSSASLTVVGMEEAGPHRAGQPMEKRDDKSSLSEKRSANLESGESKGIPEDTSYPEGGLAGWCAVVGVVLSQMASFGYTNSYGVYNDYYVRYYLPNYSSSSISWIGSVQLCLSLTGGVISGRLFDKGYFYHVMITGSVLFSVCLFMLSITKSGQFYQIFLTQGVGLGLAVGLLYVPALGVISQYFHRRRPLVLGIGTAGSALGGMLHPIMLNKWFHGSLGFHDGVRASAGLTTGVLLVSLLLMRPRNLPKKEVGPSAFSNLKTFSRDVPYVITVFGTVCMLAGLYFPIYFIQLNSVKIGIGSSLAFYTITILNGSSILGRILPTLFVSRFGPFNVLIFIALMCAVLEFCTLAVKDAAGTVVYAIMFGFFSGAYISLLPPAITSLAHSQSEIGSRLGLCFTFTGIGGLVGTPIAGALLTSQYIFWRPVVFAGICVTTGLLCFVTTRFMTAHRKGTQKV
ncbi:major facilitator superfamily domain-containing protein [Coprinopsis sp. MPI-PUGE-AT-0042]|nr:major facilitator superfamily domain-containing protein [Coprinopsis sp. MPI-PUGE-AT-0042]